MNKNLLLIVILLVTARDVAGQVFDTVYQRGKNYFYMEWYDELDVFWDSTRSPRTCIGDIGAYNNGDHVLTGRNYFTGSPIQVKGLACMIYMDTLYKCGVLPETAISDSLERLPEYLYLLSRDSASPPQPIIDSSTMKLLDSVRWDTVTPKVFKLPKHSDTSYGYIYCWLYEAMFDEPLTVDGHFFIAGTCRSNRRIGASYPLHFPRIPVRYVCVGLPSRLGTSICSSNYSGSLDGWWYPAYVGGHGPFNAIMTGNKLIQLHSDNDSMGEVLGEGFFPDSSTQYIQALPLEHFRFVSWNDGDTTNPRAVLLTQDTSFTAYFRAAEQYRLDLESNDAEHGSVYGAGIYEEGDTAKIWAEAWRGYVFAHWSDGDTANPRWVVMTQDTSFEGIFVPQEGIGEVTDGGGVRLVPNPADEYVVVSCNDAVEGVLVVTDVTGKTVRRYRMSGTGLRIDTEELPDGVYFVTLTTSRGSTTVKLVLE